MSRFAEFNEIPGVEVSEPIAVPSAQNLYDIAAPKSNDRGELLKDRFLCRGAALLVVGGTRG